MRRTHFLVAYIKEAMIRRQCKPCLCVNEIGEILVYGGSLKDERKAAIATLLRIFCDKNRRLSAIAWYWLKGETDQLPASAIEAIEKFNKDPKNARNLAIAKKVYDSWHNS